jgi:polysaccharide deacetylase family protein (PEP-CTERM system associated)
MKILTFDIEDWFHVLDNPNTETITQWNQFESRLAVGVDRILNSLDERNLKASFFILGWVAEKYPEVVKKIDALGHHIGTHSYAHQLAYTQTKKEFKDDLVKSLVLLEDILGRKVNAYRAPGFSIVEDNLWAFEALVENGIEIDSSIFPAGRAHGGLPNFSDNTPCLARVLDSELKLFPINSKNVFGNNFIYSGGGYFRLFPSFLLRKWFKEDDYIMTYFHPRDFDPEQPLLEGLGCYRRFKSYVGLNRSLKKLELILDENSFIALDQAEKLVNWNNVNKHVFKV